MLVVRLVTGITVRRRSLENSIDMAFCADRVAMRPSQLEGGSVVVKGRWFPDQGGVTGGAALSKLPLM